MLHIIEEDNLPKPWYHNKNLCFECTGCGDCCTGAPGFVWVSEEEIESIASFLNITRDQFIQKYLRQIDGKYSLIEMPVSFDCVFLKNKKCTIYSVRPTQCRTYPWWPQNLASEEHWKETAKMCEGISKEAKPVPLETIEKQLEEQIRYNTKINNDVF